MTPTAELNVCAAGGFVVGTKYAVPTEQYDFVAFPRTLLWGCNRLLCGSCGEFVQQRVGYRLGGQTADPAQLLEADDWAEFVERGWLESDDAWRTYACRCHVWAENESRALGAADDFDEFLGEYPPPWACAGHPLVELPLDLDGVHWDDHDSATGAARDFLRGDSAADVPGWAAQTPAGWLARAYVLLRHTDLVTAIAAEGADALSVDDAATRARAADLFRLLPAIAGAELAVDVLADQPAWFVGHDDPLQASRSADDRLQEVVGNRLLLDLASADEVTTAQRLLALGYVPNDWLARGLATTDPTWFLSHLETMIRAEPTSFMTARLVAVAAKIPDTDVAPPIIALARTGLADLDVLRATTRAFVGSPQREQILEALAE